VVFDVPGGTHRNQLDEAYKGNRKENARRLHSQLPLIGKW